VLRRTRLAIRQGLKVIYEVEGKKEDISESQKQDQRFLRSSTVLRTSSGEWFLQSPRWPTAVVREGSMGTTE
jgi:hypothetical protein